MSWILGIRRKGRKKMAKFISLFAGVGGFDLGMEQAGHECVAQVEWDKNAAGVLKHRWPNVPLFCDVSKVSADDLPDADFITYGFPCQDLSVAGKREGLDGKRSGLFYEATRIIKQLAERAIRRGGAGGGRFIAIAENVRGVQSSGDGYDFARCIRELHNIGASEVGWSVLDSQFFGVAQRRKRVFLVADFGGESTSEILAFSEGVSGHPPPSREAGKGTAGDARAGFTASSFGGYEQGCGTLRSQGGDLGGGSETLAVNATKGVGEVVSWNGDTTPKASEDVSVTLRSQQGGEGVGVAFHASQDPIHSEEHSPTLGSNATIGYQQNLTVRRLTPIECERLQGFPDNWTSEKMELILEGNEWKATGKVVKQADGPRYKAMGNAVTVNVAEWIGKQIGKVLNENTI
jgi:DNA (cytosine-5)-methyltransferase 1